MRKTRIFQKAQAVLLAAAVAATVLPLTLYSSAAEQDLALYYTFDTDKVTDSGPKHKDAKAYGTMDFEQEGVYGSSVLLKGGYIHMPEDIIQGFEDISVSCWVNPKRSAENSRIWSLGDGMANLLNLQSPCNEGGLRLGTSLRNDYNPTRVGSSKGELPLNQWSHVVVTYNQDDNKTLRLYVDGEEVGAKETGKLISALPLLSRAYIGRSQWSADPDFYGYVDEVKIYSRTLSAAEIQEDAQEGFQQIADNTLDRMDLAEENGLTSLSGVADDLSLPAKVEGVPVEWSSSNEAVLSKAGKVGSVTAATQVKLTAKATKNGKTQTKDFSLTVVPKGTVQPDELNAVTTVPGRVPELPEKISANGGTRSVKVNWEELSPNQYAKAGSFTASGKTAEGGVDVSVQVVVDGDSLENPLIHVTAPDPYVTYHDGYYYYARQNANTGTTVSKAKRIQDLESAPRVSVYTAPSTGMYSKEYWAPELHYIDGCWYIYVAADDGNNANHRMHVLRSTEPDNAQAPYEYVGKLTPTKYNESTKTWEPDAAQDKWAIDGTVIQDEVSGRNYFVWSGWEGNVDGMQITYIAEMLNPWTLKGDRVELSRPDQGWDQKGHGEGGGLELNEGQQIVYRNGKVYIFYSANFSGSDWYCLGQITAELGKDLTDKNNWTKKTDGPVFTQSLDPADKVYGPGHASIVQSPDGKEDWLIYHAFQSSGGGWGDRSARAQKITWDGDTPVFGNPVAFGDIIDGPSGNPDVTVYKYEAETASLSGGAMPAVRPRSSGGKAVTGLTGNGTLTFDVSVEQAGEYALSIMANSRATSGNATQKLTVNGKEYTVVYPGTNVEQDVWVPCYDEAASMKGQGLTVNLKAGKNTIVLTAAGQKADVDYLQLTLEKAEEVAPTKVTVTAQDTTIQAGKSTVVTAKVEPEGTVQAVTWSSSDPKVATVDATGKVTGVAEGKAVITATASDGKTTGSVEITVTKAEDPDPGESSKPSEPSTPSEKPEDPSTPSTPGEQPGDSSQEPDPGPDDSQPVTPDGGSSSQGGTVDGSNPVTGGAIPAAAGLLALGSLCGAAIVLKKRR